MYSSLSESVSEFSPFRIFCLPTEKAIFGKKGSLTTISTYPPPSLTSGCVSERVSSRHYSTALSAVYSDYKKQKSFISRLILGPCLLISMTSRLSGSGQPKHPYKRQVKRTSKAEIRPEEQWESEELSGGFTDWNPVERSIKTDRDTSTE